MSVNQRARGFGNTTLDSSFTNSTVADKLVVGTLVAKRIVVDQLEANLDTTGILDVITTDSGVAMPSASNINILGTAGQITTSAEKSTVTIGVPATFSFGSAAGSDSGALVAGTGGLSLSAANGPVAITSGTGAVTVGTDATIHSTTIGSTTVGATTVIQAPVLAGKVTIVGKTLSLSSTGSVLEVKGTASTSTCGTAAFGPGTGVAVVATSAVKAGDLIFISRITAPAATPLGSVFTYTILDGASFTVTSAAPAAAETAITTDTSTFAWFIVRPLA